MLSRPRQTRCSSQAQRRKLKGPPCLHASLRITKHTDYALRVLIYLASHPEERVATHRIAESFSISENHLAKVARRLGELGYVVLKRGVGGGLDLARQPDQISVGQVMRELDRPTTLIECFDLETDKCAISSACGLKGALGVAQEAFYASLDPVTIAQLIRRRRSALVDLLRS